MRLPLSLRLVHGSHQLQLASVTAFQAVVAPVVIFPVSSLPACAVVSQAQPASPRIRHQDSGQRQPSSRPAAVAAMHPQRLRPGRIQAARVGKAWSTVPGAAIPPCIRFTCARQGSQNRRAGRWRLLQQLALVGRLLHRPPRARAVVALLGTAIMCLLRRLRMQLLWQPAVVVVCHQRCARPAWETSRDHAAAVA